MHAILFIVLLLVPIAKDASVLVGVVAEGVASAMLGLETQFGAFFQIDVVQHFLVGLQLEALLGQEVTGKTHATLEKNIII